MPADREALARLLHDAVTAKARAERANLDQWDDLAAYFRANFLRMADAVIAAGWAPGTTTLHEGPEIMTGTDDMGRLVQGVRTGLVQSEMSTWSLF